MNKTILQQLAPTGVLRVGINMSNFLLVNSVAENGDPAGVSPSIALALANKLGVPVRLVPYEGPGDVADAATLDQWDIANIAAEPERAKTIAFSPAYCEIQATYLLPENSKLDSVESVDAEGVRIAIKARAAFELYLSDHLKHATLNKVESHDAAFKLFVDNSLEALAGLRPKLIEQQSQLPGSSILDASFTSVKQSIGCRMNRPEAAQFIDVFVRDAIAGGLVQSLIEKHNVTGKLSVAALS